MRYYTSHFGYKGNSFLVYVLTKHSPTLACVFLPNGNLIRHMIAAATPANAAHRRQRLRALQQQQQRARLNHAQHAGQVNDRIRITEDLVPEETPENARSKSRPIQNDLDVEDEWN